MDGEEVATQRTSSFQLFIYFFSSNIISNGLSQNLNPCRSKGVMMVLFNIHSCKRYQRGCRSFVVLEILLIQHSFMQEISEKLQQFWGIGSGTERSQSQVCITLVWRQVGDSPAALLPLLTVSPLAATQVSSSKSWHCALNLFLP